MSDDKMDVESVKVVDAPGGGTSAPMLPEHAGNGKAAAQVQRALPAPQSKSQDEEGSWVGKLVSLLVVVAMIVGGYLAYPWAKSWLEGGTAKMRPPQRPAPVVLAGHRGDLPVYLNEIGTVIPQNTVTIHTRVDGQLLRVNFTEGQMVEEGQVLAELDRRPFEVQLAQANGQMARDVAVLESAQADLKKFSEAGNAVSRQQLDTAAAAVKQAQGNIASDDGTIASAKLNIAYCTITSPLSGKIGLRTVDQGNIVHASDANGLAVITQVQPIAVLFSISQDDVPPVLKKMNEGQKLAVDAFDRGLINKLASGTLEASESEMDQTTGNLRFKAVFGNKDGELFPNQFVNIRVLVDTEKNVVIVPTAAVQISPDSKFVYVMKKSEDHAESRPANEGNKTADVKEKSTENAALPEGVVEMRKVEVGDQEGDDTVIINGIEPGDEVVVDGVDKLQDGAKVTVGRAAPATQASGPATTADSVGGSRKRRNP